MFTWFFALLYMQMPGSWIAYVRIVACNTLFVNRETWDFFRGDGQMTDKLMIRS